MFEQLRKHTHVVVPVAGVGEGPPQLILIDKDATEEAHCDFSLDPSDAQSHGPVGAVGYFFLYRF